MTNRVGDLCDISSGPNPLFPPSEDATSDDQPEDEEPISEAEPSSDIDDNHHRDEDEEEDDEDVEEIEEPVPLQVESVAHRLVNDLISLLFSVYFSYYDYLFRCCSFHCFCLDLVVCQFA